MEALKNQPETKQSAPVTTPVSTSCWKNNSNEEATFLEGLKFHIDDFVHTSMDEHKECFKKQMQKVFNMPKKFTEKSSDPSRKHQSQTNQYRVISRF